MSDPCPFKWRHFEADIILCAVQGYLRYALSYSDVEELLRQRSVSVDHSPVCRWIQRYAPELDRRGRPYLHATNDSYHVDETSIRINKHWYYLDRAVDSADAVLDLMLSPIRHADAAARFFRKILQASHTLTPRLITVDNYAAYPPAFEALQQEGTLPETCQLRQCKYLNNTVEQDHRFVKCGVDSGLGFGAYAPAQWIIQGYEAIDMLCTGLIEGIAQGDVLAQSCVVNRMFGLAARGVDSREFSRNQIVFATSLLE